MRRVMWTMDRRLGDGRVRVRLRDIDACGAGIDKRGQHKSDESGAHHQGYAEKPEHH